MHQLTMPCRRRDMCGRVQRRAGGNLMPRQPPFSKHAACKVMMMNAIPLQAVAQGILNEEQALDLRCRAGEGRNPALAQWEVCPLTRRPPCSPLLPALLPPPFSFLTHAGLPKAYANWEYTIAKPRLEAALWARNNLNHNKDISIQSMIDALRSMVPLLSPILSATLLN
jgi:hypothetical protein